jgi:hypothetical protein
MVSTERIVVELHVLHALRSVIRAQRVVIDSGSVDVFGRLFRSL